MTKTNMREKTGMVKCGMVKMDRREIMEQKDTIRLFKKRTEVQKI